MIRINLIPPEYIERINRKAVIAKVVLVAVLVIAAVSLISVWQFTREKTISYTLTKRQGELAVLKKDVDQVKAIEAKIAEVQKYLNAINSVNRGRLFYTRFMQELTSDLPATIWFNSVITTVRGDSMSVNLELRSRSVYDLAYWINYLETSGAYSNVTVGTINVADEEDGKVFSAPLSFSYAAK